MADTGKKLFLLDGMALVYRAHFALIRNPRIASTGMNTSAVFACTNTLLQILGKEEPTHIAAVFDTPEPTMRHKEYPEYKAQREAMPEDLSDCLPYVFRMFEAFNIPVIKQPGFEADDIIGTLALQADAQGFQTFMVTPDKDFAQLVSETAFMYKPGKSGSGAEVLGVPEILESWEIENVDQVRDILGLWGDTSDNIPGVPGIGEKTSKKLVAQFGSMENLLESTHELKGKQKENLETFADQARLSKRLVTIVRDVPLEHAVDDLVRRSPDDEALKQLFVEMEFRTLGRRMFGEDFDMTLQRSTNDAAADADIAVRAAADIEHTYEIVEGAEARATLIAKLLEQDAVCFDSETTGLDSKECEIVGFAFSFAERTGFYVPFPEDKDANRAVLDEFRPFFDSEDVLTVGHNLKYDLSVLRWHGVAVSGPLFDTMLAAHLATPELRRSMDYLAEALLAYRPMSISDLIGERGEEQQTLREVPVEQVAEYAAEDADITYQLFRKYEPLLKEMGQERVFHDIECPLIPALVEMEYEGIRLEAPVLERLSGELADDIEMAEARIYELAGEEFNLGSPKQLGELLFGKMELDPNAKKTKTGQFATNEQVLARLAPEHEIVAQVLDYRASTKLKSTYVDTLPGAVYERTGHIHTHYEQAVTATGRMQSSGPNLQNIPIRREKGQEIRRAFVPRGPEFTLLAADYSQIELRLAAELSGDEGMRAAFLNNEDIHTATALKLHDVEPEDVTREMRDRAKTVNFGIIYGISAFGLAQRLNIPRGEAAELIDSYFAQYPGVRQYMDDTIEFTREHGYAETILGRRRYLRDIASRNATTRQAAERNAINSRIQGSAADMIKIAMSRIHRELDARGLRTRMLLQVHDELVFDMHRDEQGVVMPLVEDAMVNALDVSVPIVVEMGTGESWLEAH
ncbi:DNA polymerase I [Candidatus Poribacteria bacterium]|nr:DNA polymerase I [Candidatus Poribacteria bacterium]